MVKKHNNIQALLCEHKRQLFENLLSLLSQSDKHEMYECINEWILNILSDKIGTMICKFKYYNPFFVQIIQ